MPKSKIKERKKKPKKVRIYLNDGTYKDFEAMAKSMELTIRELMLGSTLHMLRLYTKVEKDESDFIEHCHDSDPTFSDVEESSYRDSCGDMEDSDEREVRRRDAAAIAEGASMLAGQEGGKDA